MLYLVNIKLKLFVGKLKELQMILLQQLKCKKNLYHQAQVELKAERKKERTQKVQEFKDRIKKEFATLKSKIKI